jgi:hypothetical protein
VRPLVPIRRKTTKEKPDTAAAVKETVRKETARERGGGGGAPDPVIAALLETLDLPASEARRIEPIRRKYAQALGSDDEVLYQAALVEDVVRRRKDPIARARSLAECLGRAVRDLQVLADDVQQRGRANGHGRGLDPTGGGNGVPASGPRTPGVVHLTQDSEIPRETKEQERIRREFDRRLKAAATPEETAAAHIWWVGAVHEFNQREVRP